MNNVNRYYGSNYSLEIKGSPKLKLKWVPKKSKSLPENTKDLEQRVKELSVKTNFQSDSAIKTEYLKNRITIENRPALFTFYQELGNYWSQREWNAIIKIVTPYFQDESTHTIENRPCFVYLHQAFEGRKDKLTTDQKKIQEELQKWLEDTARPPLSTLSDMINDYSYDASYSKIIALVMPYFQDSSNRTLENRAFFETLNNALKLTTKPLTSDQISLKKQLEEWLLKTISNKIHEVLANPIDPL